MKMRVHENHLKEIKILNLDEIESFLDELQIVLYNKNIGPEQLATLTQLELKDIRPLFSNKMDLNQEVLNKIIEVLNLKVVIQLQIEDL